MRYVTYGSKGRPGRRTPILGTLTTGCVSAGDAVRMLTVKTTRRTTARSRRGRLPMAGMLRRDVTGSQPAGDPFRFVPSTRSTNPGRACATESPATIEGRRVSRLAGHPIRADVRCPDPDQGTTSG